MNGGQRHDTDPCHDAPPRASHPIRVLLIGATPPVRTALTATLARAPDVDLVGRADSLRQTRDLILAFRPEIILLGLPMQHIDPLDLLDRLREHYPVPVLVVCTPAAQHRRLAMDAVARGALDVVVVPETIQADTWPAAAETLLDRLRAVASAVPAKAAPSPPLPPGAAEVCPSFWAAGIDPRRYLVAIGASTGGTEAILRLLSRAPADFPPVAIVQHMPEGFTEIFATRLDRLTPLRVREARNGDTLEPGVALVARGGVQLRITGTPARWKALCAGSEPVNRHCPSVDVLFHSVARAAGPHAIGVILTGMGDDGARGLAAMKHRGAITIAQDRTTSVVYGMPKQAVALGAATHQARPEEIPALICRLLAERRRHTAPASDKAPS